MYYPYQPYHYQLDQSPVQTYQSQPYYVQQPPVQSYPLYRGEEAQPQPSTLEQQMQWERQNEDLKRVEYHRNQQAIERNQGVNGGEGEFERSEKMEQELDHHVDEQEKVAQQDESSYVQFNERNKAETGEEEEGTEGEVAVERATVEKVEKEVEEVEIEGAETEQADMEKVVEDQERDSAEDDERQAYPMGFTMPQVPVEGMLPLEMSLIENILRMNKGKLARVYMTFEGRKEDVQRMFEGIIEAAGRDHIILSDPETGERYLLLMVYLDYVQFDEEIQYFF